MPTKRKRVGDGKEDKEDSPGPSQPVKRKKKVLQYDPVSGCSSVCPYKLCFNSWNLCNGAVFGISQPFILQ